MKAVINTARNATIGGTVGHAPGAAAGVGLAVANEALDRIPQGLLAQLDLNVRNGAEGIYNAAQSTGVKMTPQAAIQLSKDINASMTDLQPQ